MIQSQAGINQNRSHPRTHALPGILAHEEHMHVDQFPQKKSGRDFHKVSIDMMLDRNGEISATKKI